MGYMPYSQLFYFLGVHQMSNKSTKNVKRVLVHIIIIIKEYISYRVLKTVRF